MRRSGTSKWSRGFGGFAPGPPYRPGRPRPQTPDGLNIPGRTGSPQSSTATPSSSTIACSSQRRTAPITAIAG
ncbi:hypothetical protein CP970_10300 [Streptomyces kanamyceticus]|uniref:Uncharacterized protein n=1 Tax=Streptomyces kanamyceticus TaxID=1967 RepID=A0A5J6G892_STRKN|nr:hypothetical protein CP970_10300 [Streptomyces kanamyceticus]